MATLTVGRHIGIRTAEHYKEGTSGSLSRVANMLWRVSYGFSLSGLFLPVEPAYRHSNTLSLKEKTEIEGHLMGL